jgi:hypothetical protein
MSKRAKLIAILCRSTELVIRESFPLWFKDERWSMSKESENQPGEEDCMGCVSSRDFHNSLDDKPAMESVEIKESYGRVQ